VTTGRCERALVTLLGSAGPWRERLYLVGGLAPRYLVSKLPDGVPAHVGTTDVDLVIKVVVDVAEHHAYRTLAANLKEAGFEAFDSCRWATEVDGVTVKLEFLCETDAVPPGRSSSRGATSSAPSWERSTSPTPLWLRRTSSSTSWKGSGSTAPAFRESRYAWLLC
jgi:hypothetical protein